MHQTRRVHRRPHVLGAGADVTAAALGGRPADANLKEALRGREVRPVTSPGQQ